MLPDDLYATTYVVRWPDGSESRVLGGRLVAVAEWAELACGILGGTVVDTHAINPHAAPSRHPPVEPVRGHDESQGRLL